MSVGAGPRDAILAESALCYEWQSPEDLKDRSDRLNALLHWRGNPAQEFREAYIASRFAIMRGAAWVRLLTPGATPTPDFEMQIGADVLRYETTEASIPEALNPASQQASGVIFTTLVRLTESIGQVSAKKATKPYIQCRGLVIYLSAPPFFFNPTERWTLLLDASCAAAIAFREVWIVRDLTKGALLWQDGQAQPEAEF